MTKKKLGRPPVAAAIPKSKVDKLFFAIFKHFGKSQTDTADALGCSQSYVWGCLRKTHKNTLPPLIAMRAEVVTGGKFQCEDLCPDIKDLLATIISNRIKAGTLKGTSSHDV